MNGRQINRFLNLCSRNGIRLWKISYDIEHNIRANLRLKDIYYVKPYLRKTKTRLKIISRKGFPFWRYRHPRLTFLLCVSLFIICVGIYSLNFVWNIEIKGNTKVSSNEIIECLHENKISIGVKKDAIDCASLEVYIRERFQQVGWVSVYIKNMNLCVEIKESLYDVMEPSDLSKETYHLISNKDAIIHSIVVRSGKALVKEGQEVKAGEILVLGQNEIFDDNGEIKEVVDMRADALIWADVSYDIRIPLTEMEILALRISDKFLDESLINLGYRKIRNFLECFEKNGVILLKQEITIEKKEKQIFVCAKIRAREKIGINIPVEENRANEFE